MAASSSIPNKGDATYDDLTEFWVEGKSQTSVTSAMNDIKAYSRDIYTEKALETDIYRDSIAQLSLEQVWLNTLVIMLFIAVGIEKITTMKNTL